MQLRKAKVSFVHIKHIFISHLHGDHFYGLPGLVSSFRLLGREASLHIYGPKGIKEALLLLMKLSKSNMNYPLHFHELSSEQSECVFEDDNVLVRTIPLKHRVYTNGFLFEEKIGLRRIDADAAQAAGIDKSHYRLLQQGKDVESNDGTLVENKKVTFAPHPVMKYAYCSDTAYHPPIIDIIHKVDWLYHEATFLNQHNALAAQTMHSTAQQAAEIAKKAEVGRLILGHYSSRYKDLALFVDEAKAVFPNVILAADGAVIS